jgi:two-component system, LytTR family, sensor kinase
MKRLFLHISFWTIYVLQDTFLELVWSGVHMPGSSDRSQFLLSMQGTLAVLIPKVLFTYFILYHTLPGVLKDERNLFSVAIEFIFASGISIIVYDFICYYYVYPYVYHGTDKTIGIFAARRVLLAIINIGYVSGSAVTLKLLRSQLAAKDREKKLVSEKLEAELRFLRNQTHPHFLFNTLNNIFALARKKSDQTAEVVLKLSKLLRFMLYESDKGAIPISEEIRLLNDYIELERLRYDDRLTITFQKQIDRDSQPITPLLLLPFIENAFKHGISESRFQAFIHISLDLQNGFLIFTIENSKEPKEAAIATDTIGLGNVRRQLELIYKEYKMEVQNEQTFFKVRLAINLNSHATI